MSFRLGFDFEIPFDLETSQFIARDFIDWLRKRVDESFDGEAEVRGMKYKLSRDIDRRANNYLDIDENGHCSGKKLPLFP